MPTYTRHHFDSPFWTFHFAKEGLDEIANYALAGIVAGALTRRAIDIIAGRLPGVLGDLADGMAMLEPYALFALTESEFELDLADLRSELDFIQESATTIDGYRDVLANTLFESDGPFWKFHADLGDVLAGYGGPINPASVPFEELILMEGWEPPARGRPSF